MEAPQRVIDRVLARLDMRDPDACWPWPGALFGTGYGHIAWQVNNKQFHRSVHRVVYSTLVGPIPDGCDLDHTCHDPADCHPQPASDCPHRRCCNPAHLEPVDHQTNLLRGGTIVAMRAAITHCPQGHPYDRENTWIDAKGRRTCRECRRIKNRAVAPEVKAVRNRAYRLANRERISQQRKARYREQKASRLMLGEEPPESV